jgi:hypothetical protein
MLFNQNAMSTGAAPAAYTIDNSLRFRSAASANLNRTPSVTGSASVWTWSGWVKRGSLGSNVALFSAAATTSAGTSFRFTSDTLDVYRYNGSAYNWRLTTTQLFRDPSAWYHIVIAFDSGQATSTDRVKLYVNGTQVTAFSTSNYPTTSYAEVNGSGYAHYIGRSFAASEYFDGYQAEVNFIDGQALTPTSFGETDATTGVWKAKQYTGSYGTNGFYLKFSSIALTSGSNTGLGQDFSGNGNYWNTNNISVTSGITYDAMVDSPSVTAGGTRPVGNYAVINPLVQSTGLSGGNLNVVTLTSYSGATAHSSSIALPNTGKFYWEYTQTAAYSGAASVKYFGIASAFDGASSSKSAVYLGDGTKLLDGVTTSYGSSWTTNDVIACAVDLDGGTVTFYKNGVSQGSISYAGTSGFYAFISDGNSSFSLTGSFNFGQRPFSYTPPSGFVALCTSNLPNSTIVKGNQYMDATLFTGNGSTQTITNAGGFSPDFVWIKTRGSAQNNSLFDAVRGANQYLWSNLTNAETSSANGLTAFNSNGFSVGSNSDVNQSTISMVAWQWDAGTTTVTNTDGTISSQVRANTTSGFSIVTYTGTGANATVGHGLGVAPKMIIFKNRSVASNSLAYLAEVGAVNIFTFNSNSAASSTPTALNSTAPTSSVFSVGTSANTNGSTNNIVAYCFAEIAGFSRFGSYVGTKNTDGPFVYTGFRPKYILLKYFTSGTDWTVIDSSRSPANVSVNLLQPNTTAVESSLTTIDFYSNGFKPRTSNTTVNDSGGPTYYIAFAENPFKYALAR